MSTIAIFGDVMLDSYISGPCHRLSPEAPVPVICASLENHKHVPGGAANVAHQIAKLHKGKTLLYGIVGDEKAPHKIGDKERSSTKGKKRLHNYITNRELTIQLANYNVVLKPLAIKGHVTTHKARHLIKHGIEQQIARFDTEIKCNHQGSKKILAQLDEVRPKYIILSDYAKGFFNPKIAQTIIKRAKNNKAFVAVDAKSKNLTYYLSTQKDKSADLVKPNFGEFCELANIDHTIVTTKEQQDAIIEKQGREFAQTYHATRVITRSEHGASIITPDGEVAHIPTQAKEVYDVSGAGDTVLATIIASYNKGYTLHEAVQRANHAASIAISKQGTYAISAKELGR